MRVCACVHRETAQGQELVWAGEINWRREVLLELQWLTLIISGLNKKAPVFPMKPPLVGEAGEEGRAALRSHPGTATCTEILARPCNSEQVPSAPRALVY